MVKKTKKKKMRISKDQYYLNIAREVAKRGTCLRRNFGAVIVKEDQIISTGYTGSPRGTLNCIDIDKCYREELHIPKGKRYELCRGVHAEQNAIIDASRLDMIGSTIYLVCLDASTNKVVDKAEPCRLCKRMIINAGITKVIILESKGRITRKNPAVWGKNNLGEIKKIHGQYEFIKQEGY